MRQGIWSFPFYRWRNRGSERSFDLPHITSLVNNKDRTGPDSRVWASGQPPYIFFTSRGVLKDGQGYFLWKILENQKVFVLLLILSVFPQVINCALATGQAGGLVLGTGIWTINLVGPLSQQEPNALLHRVIGSWGKVYANQAKPLRKILGKRPKWAEDWTKNERKTQEVDTKPASVRLLAGAQHETQTRNTCMWMNYPPRLLLRKSRQPPAALLGLGDCLATLINEMKD